MSMVSGSLRKLPTAQQSPAEQKAFFDQHGFAIVRGCLSQGELEDCAAAVRELHERAAAGQPGQFQFEPFAKDFLTEDHLPVLRKIERTDDLSPVFHRLARHPKIVATWQNVIGDENLLLFRSTLMLKPAHHGSAHALHQDAAYWPLRPAGSAVAVSVALQDADSSNGCFRVIPTSHRWGLKYWGDISRKPGDDIITPMQPTDNATKRLAKIDAIRPGIDGSGRGTAPSAEMLAEQIEVPLRAGDALFFHSLTAHGSDANHSPNARNTALFAAFSPSARYVPAAGGAPSAKYPVVCGMDGALEHKMIADCRAGAEDSSASKL